MSAKTKKPTKAQVLERDRVERQAHFREIEGRMSSLFTALNDAVGRRKSKNSSAHDSDK